MKPRTLLVLTLLVAGLSAFWWLYERKLPGSDQQAELAKKLLPIEEKAVTGVTVEWQGRKVRLEREPPPPAVVSKDEGLGAPPADPPARWRLVEPMEAPAEDTAVNGMLGSLLNLQKERTLDGGDRKDAGLDEPRARVTVTTAAGAHTVEIGRDIPASSNMVVGVVGETDLYVVGNYLVAQVTKEPNDWRGKEIFHGSRDEIDRVSLTPTGGSPLVLAKRGEELWLEAPLADRVDRDLGNGLLATIANLRAESYVDETPSDLATLGLAPAAGKVEVVVHGKTQPFVIEVGTPVTEAGAPLGTVRYARTTSDAGSQLFTTMADFGPVLSRLAAEWQSKTWSTLEVYQIDKVHADGAGVPAVDAARDGADWRRGGEKGEKIAFTPVSDFLYAMTGVRADQVTAEPVTALGQPTLTAQLSGNGQEETLTAYPPRGELVPVRVSGREATLLVQAATIAELRDKLNLVRTAEPVPGEAGDDDDAPSVSTPSAAAGTPTVAPEPAAAPKQP